LLVFIDLTVKTALD